MDATDPGPLTTSVSELSWSPVVELRQYTLHPGQRDLLIDLFDREFIESQEALGITVIGQFRDLDDPDRFVWLRGFPEMDARQRSLQDFYGGAVWAAHREVANATMVDSDNVLLLRPARATSGFSASASPRPAPGVSADDAGLVVAAVYTFDSVVSDAVIDCFERETVPLLRDMGATTLAYFATEQSANNFPRLPIRESEHVFVWFAAFSDRGRGGRATPIPVALEHAVGDSLWLAQPQQVLRLTPTSRSSVTGLSPTCPAMSTYGFGREHGSLDGS